MVGSDDNIDPALRRMSPSPPPVYYDRHYRHEPYMYTPPIDRYDYPPMQQHFPVPYTQRPYPTQTPPVTIVHTDDAATKLTDGIRRRCFNCCTTDTSTWRRSNLSPGKVLCNKCGLFERTHSRPRPDQFPHKRGPLASSTLRGRTPPAPPPQLPPINGNYYHYQQQLPGLQTWQNTSGSSTSSSGDRRHDTSRPPAPLPPPPRRYDDEQRPSPPRSSAPAQDAPAPSRNSPA